MARVAALFLIVGTLFQAVAAQAEEFYFPHLGVRITAADGWEIVSGSEFSILNRNASFGTEELDAILRDDGGEPFFSMLSDERLGSTVKAGFNAFAFGGRIDDIDLAATNMENFMLSSFREARLEKDRTSATLGDLDAVTMALTYTLELAGGTTRRIYEEIWLIPREDFYITISYGSLEADKDPDLWQQIRDTLNSISWEEPT